MKRGKQIDTWYPFFIDKWLFGSTRHELIINAGWAEKFPDLVPLIPESILHSPFTDLRGIFQDIMTMSKKDGGFVRSNETMPYPLEQLAGMWCVPLDCLKATIAICLHPKVGKLAEPLPGIYYVTSTETYGFSDRWKRKVGKMESCSEIAEQGSEKGEPILKDRIGKDSKKKNYPDAFAAEDVRLVELLAELMGKNNPQSSILKRLTPEGRGRWADVCRKLREIDGRTPEEIEAVIRFSQEDPFWSGNILSMPTLREKWDRLVMKARRIRSEGQATRVGAHRPETAKEKESSRQVGELLKKLWAEAKPELEAARGRGRKAFDALYEQKEREIEHAAAEFSRKLQGEVNP